MSTDENYWDRIFEERLQDGYYWYRDSITAEPEIVKSIMTYEKERRLFFSFGYVEAYETSVREILSRYPDAQIAVGRIVPPNEQA